MSRGSAIYSNPEGSEEIEGLGDRFRYFLDDGNEQTLIQEIQKKDFTQVVYREPRPIPPSDDVFEKVWEEFRKNRDKEKD